MKHIFWSFLLVLGFGVFGVQTAGAAPSIPYGESIAGGPSAGVYILTGTLSSNELGDVYVSATGASKGLFYDKNSYTLTGSVYSTNIGLIEVTSINNSGFVSGIKVCDGEDLPSISAPCNITGSTSTITIYSPAIGTMSGANGQVDPSSKKIQGVNFTHIGFGGTILSFSGINLVPKATNLTGGDFGTGVYYTNHSGAIHIFDDGTLSSNTKTIRLTPTTLSGSITNVIKDYSTTTDTFTGVDISIAGNYIYEMNIDGIISRGRIKVIASEVNTTSYTSINSTFFYKYCSDNQTDTSTNYKSTCPEKDIPKSSHLDYDSNNKQANNKDDIKLSLSLRDQYGNRISSVPNYLAIDITRNLTSGQLLQTDIPMELTGGASLTAAGFQGLRIPQGAWSGTTSATSISYSDYTMESDNDLLIQLYSSTPGRLQVEWKTKTRNIFGGSSADIGPGIILTTGDITFEGLIKDNGLIISPTGNILRNRESIFSHKYTISDSGSISTPHLEYIITTSSGEIVDQIRSAASDICNILNNTGTTSIPSTPCAARNRDSSILGEISNTLFGVDIPKTNSGTIDIGLTFATGSMTSTGTNTGYLIVMASYKVDGQDILYPLINQSFKTEESSGTIPLKILGQIGSSDLGTSMKSLDLLSSNLINTERDKIRKQAQMMRQNFVNHPLTITGGTILSNQVYIVEGDIYINADIWATPLPKPKVLIALKKSDGSGGNIYISTNVKNIAASLIADGSIFGWDGSNIKTEGNNQLYICGSIMSNNTIGGTGLNRCPQNTTTCTATTAINYDFEKIRKLDVSTGGSTATNAPDTSTSFIIEHDPRLVQDSPLVLMRELAR